MITFKAIPTDQAKAFRNGAPDAHGNAPERTINNDDGNPCRHCLRTIPSGEEMLVLAYRPFEGKHPYAEVGPIYLCAKDCEQGNSTDLPEVFKGSPDYLVKGYGPDERIVYGTGQVAPRDDMARRIAEIFEQSDVAFVHVRSARNNCLLARVERG